MDWMYNNSKITDVSQFPINTFGFVYRIRHIPSNKAYIGKKVLIHHRKVKVTKKDLLIKLSFSQKFIPIYTDYVCRIFAAKLGKSRRCLILDLDNTLWGGLFSSSASLRSIAQQCDGRHRNRWAVQRVGLGVATRSEADCHGDIPV